MNASDHAVYQYIPRIKSQCSVEHALEEGVKKLRAKFYKNYTVTTIKNGGNGADSPTMKSKSTIGRTPSFYSTKFLLAQSSSL